MEKEEPREILELKADLVELEEQVKLLVKTELRLRRAQTELLRSKETIAEYGRTLEQKVEERTRELTLAKQRADAANRAKSEFLANMSHEIRTPINAVTGFADLLKTTRLSAEQKDYVETICKSGELLLALINDVLDMSKIESGKIELDEADFNLADLIGGAVTILRRQIGSKPVEVRLLYAENVPKDFTGDPTRIRQIFLNLVGNAIKFTDKGAVTIRVERAANGAAGSNASMLRISVKDTGIGIPKEKQDAIFEAFTQVDSSITRKYGGSGLGLTITKSLVEMMGGTVFVNSEPGIFTEFIVTLPLAHGRPAAEEDAAVIADTQNEKRRTITSDIAGGAAAEGIAVLIVDDNTLNQKLMGILLTKMGNVFDIAHDGREAIAKVKVKKFDLIFMDIQMPVMDGFEAATIIRSEMGITTPIIALTAHVFKEDREKCGAAGMDDFLAKPVAMNALKEILYKWGKK